MINHGPRPGPGRAQNRGEVVVHFHSLTRWRSSNALMVISCAGSRRQWLLVNTCGSSHSSSKVSMNGIVSYFRFYLFHPFLRPPLNLIVNVVVEACSERNIPSPRRTECGFLARASSRDPGCIFCIPLPGQVRSSNIKRHFPAPRTSGLRLGEVLVALPRAVVLHLD